MKLPRTVVTIDRLAPGDVVLIPDDTVKGMPPMQALVMAAEPNGLAHYVEFFCAHRGEFVQLAWRAEPGRKIMLSHPPQL